MTIFFQPKSTDYHRPNHIITTLFGINVQKQNSHSSSTTHLPSLIYPSTSTFKSISFISPLSIPTSNNSNHLISSPTHILTILPPKKHTRSSSPFHCSPFQPVIIHPHLPTPSTQSKLNSFISHTMIFRRVSQPNRYAILLVISTLVCLLLQTLGAPISALPNNAPLAFKGFDVILLTAILLAVVSIVKSFNIIPYAHRTRVDRMVMFFIFTIFAIFFFQQVALASATGDLSIHRFFQFFVAGGICAFLTHAVCTPIDVIKTRIQTTQGRYHGMVDAFRKIVSEEGSSTLLKGLGATASGYFLHGAFKYSFYEVFKVLFSPNAAIALKPPLSIAALSGFFAECIACLLLCPMEAIRIRSVADASFPSGVLTGLTLLLKTEGIHGWYKGLPAMLLKQVPYTVGQFVSFELAVTVVKGIVRVFLGITGESAFASISSIAGLLAGIIAAIISHPGDTILSKINQEESEGSAVSQIIRVARTTGFVGLFLGLGPRIIQVGCMIGGQFLIYDSIKLWCGITPASALPTDQNIATTAAVVATGVKAGETAIRAIKKLRR